MNKLFPIFSTEAHLGRSILTAEAVKEGSEIDNNCISVIGIAKKHNINPLIVADSNFFSFPKLYKHAKDIKTQLIYGIWFDVANSMSEDSSRVIVFMKNSGAYRDLCKIFSKAHSAENGGKITWEQLNLLFTDNLSLHIPFYDSFIYQNLFSETKHTPVFSQIKDIKFHVCNITLPFTEIVKAAIMKHRADNHIQVHYIRYLNNDDILPYQIFRCIDRRSMLEKPQLDHFSSNEFSFESYLRNRGA